MARGILWCKHCGNEVHGGLDCSACGGPLIPSPLPELDPGCGPEVGYHLAQWDPQMRRRLIGSLIDAGVLHRIEDEELVVLSVDEATVDRVASRVSRGLVDQVTGQPERRQKDLPALPFVESGTVQHGSEAVSPPASQEHVVSGPGPASSKAPDDWPLCPHCHLVVQPDLYPAHLPSCKDDDAATRAGQDQSAYSGTYKGIITSADGKRLKCPHHHGTLAEAKACAAAEKARRDQEHKATGQWPKTWRKDTSAQKPKTLAGKLGEHALKALGAGVTVPFHLMNSYSEERQQRGVVERAARTGCAWVILGPFVATFMVAFVFATVSVVIWAYAAVVALVALVAVIVQTVTTRHFRRGEPS